MATPRVSLGTIARAWGRIGITGFGGPAAHIALLRRLCVDERRWMATAEFEDAVAASSLLPGPASTQLAIYCALRLHGPVGALVGGICFIVPGLVVILALSVLFLARHPPMVVAAAAAGAGAAVPVVALHAAGGLLPASWGRARSGSGRPRWAAYLAAGGLAGMVVGPWLPAVLVSCGALELVLGGGNGSSRSPGSGPGGSPGNGDSGRGGGPGNGDSGPGGGPVRGSLGLALPGAPALALGAGGLLAVAWVAFKVGALSYGGGFVIIPLMQHDAVVTYHWMTSAQFLGAVALGQLTPGPVVQTVAVVGYAAAGLGGGLLASGIAFAPSFGFVLGGGSRFGRLRGNASGQAFLRGAGPAAIGAIAGAALPLGQGLQHLWQVAVLALSVAWLLVARRGVVTALLLAGLLGIVAVLAGAPTPR